jgi:hypothetical protein
LNAIATDSRGDATHAGASSTACVGRLFSNDGRGDKLFDFAKVLLFVSFGYGPIAFYESPLPGIGVSFSNLITDQTFYFQSVLEARAFDTCISILTTWPVTSCSQMPGRSSRTCCTGRCYSWLRLQKLSRWL